MDILRKLQITETTGIWIIDAPDEFTEQIQSIESVMQVYASVSKGDGILALLAFVRHRTDLDRIGPALLSHLTDRTVLWFAYPKKSSKRYRSDVTRDTGWEVLGEAGWEPVRQIAVDENWSALRFKPVAAIKRMTRRESMILSEEGKKRVRES